MVAFRMTLVLWVLCSIRQQLPQDSMRMFTGPNGFVLYGINIHSTRSEKKLIAQGRSIVQHLSDTFYT